MNTDECDERLKQIPGSKPAYKRRRVTSTMSDNESASQRGLTLISALINFVDWLDRKQVIRRLPETERAQLVLKFLEAHSEGENYFIQAEQIMEILGAPFTEES